MTITDLTGKRFGRLTIVEREASKTTPGGRVLHFWKCVCDCGKFRVVRHNHLLSGATKSCRCLSNDSIRARAALHDNATDKSEYGCWVAMNDRCRRQGHEAFARYGGRGISVCERWRESFEAFLEDMGPRPSPMHSIERKDNDGDYCPANCKWATKKEQGRNRFTNRIIEHNGESLCLSEWAERTGIGVTTIRERLRRGWSVARAIETKP